MSGYLTTHIRTKPESSMSISTMLLPAKKNPLAPSIHPQNIKANGAAMPIHESAQTAAASLLTRRTGATAGRCISSTSAALWVESLSVIFSGVWRGLLILNIWVVPKGICLRSFHRLAYPPADKAESTKKHGPKTPATEVSIIYPRENLCFPD